MAGSALHPIPIRSQVLSSNLVRSARADGGTADIDSALSRHISVQLQDASVDTALGVVAALSGVRLNYNTRDISAIRARVSVHVEDTRTDVVLLRVLDGTDLVVTILRPDEVLITSKVGARARRGTTPPDRSITGVITDAQSGTAVFGAIVRVMHHNRQAVSGTGGRFEIDGLSPGPYILVVRALGYLPDTARVQVDITGSQTLSLHLQRSPVLLDQVVTTATGAAPLKELGNNIATMTPDTLVKSGTVATLSDVLTTRVPGLEVFSNGGMVGESPAINIRGQNSFALSNQPLLYVDGARVSNTDAGQDGNYGFNTGRFNDIAPDEIESIEVVKGPSAATLYGVDAANGVILVRTKHGAAGGTRWTVFGGVGTLNLDRGGFRDPYYGWGHTLDGTNTPTTCGLASIAQGACAQDSVTHFNPLKSPLYSPIGTGHDAQGGLQVSGGTQAINYFMSGNYENQIGVLQLPQADRGLVTQVTGLSPSGNVERPNSLTKYSARENLNASLNQSAEVGISAAYVSNLTYTPPTNSLVYGLTGPGFLDSTGGYFAGIRPGYLFIPHNSEDVSHLTASVAPVWHPSTWFSARATTGIDFSSRYNDYLARAGETPYDLSGTRTNAKTNTTLYTADVSASATAPLGAIATFRTTIGGQYNRQSILQNGATATGLAPGAGTTAGAITPGAPENTYESLTAGIYAEEAVAIRERLFLSAAVRADGAGAFGSAFRAATYPKFSASWLVSSESFWPRQPVLTSLRLRSAYGASGVQPPPGAALAQEQLIPAIAFGGPTTGSTLTILGNPALRPETQREYEGGADLDFFQGRLHLEGTYFDKHSSDALVTIALPPSEVYGFQTVNIGAVRNWGYEASASLRVVDSRALTADVTVSGSISHNTLLSLSSSVPPNFGGTGNTGIVAGYPLWSWFDRPVGFSDANHDGIIEPNEIQLGSQRFLGQSYPKNQWSVSPTVGLLHGILRAAAVFDYRGGMTLFDEEPLYQCFFQVCQGLVDRHASLRSQAAAVAATVDNDFAGYYVDASFWRLRELSLTYTLPHSVSRAMRVRDASISLAGRNLALWTKWPGVDPEVSSSPGYAAAGAYQDNGGVPPTRDFLVRINLGL